MFTAISTIFASVGLIYGLLLPLFLSVVLAFFMMVSLHQSGARPAGTGKALYCYLQQSFGILLMALSGLPSIESILNGKPFAANTYMALLILFTVGGLIFLWHDFAVRSVQEPSRAVPYVIYFYTFRFLGFVLAILAFLSLLLSMLLGPRPLPVDFWVSPVVLFLFGTVLTWSTHNEPLDQTPFRSLALGSHMKPMMPAIARKAIAQARIVTALKGRGRSKSKKK